MTGTLRSFLIARTAVLVAGLFLSTVLIFVTLRVLPGDVAQQMAGVEATPEQVAALREQLGLDRPLLAQYLDWLAGVFTLDLGDSLITGVPVAQEIFDKSLVTVPLGLLTLVVAFGVSIPAGYAAAVRHDRRSGHVFSFVFQALSAIPPLWSGLLLIIIFGLSLGWFPTSGFPSDGWSDPAAALRALVLPALTAGLAQGAVLFRYVRSAVLEVVSADYVRSGAAKGSTFSRAQLREGAPNAALSVFTLFGMQIAVLLGGTIVAENLFQLPGLGRMLVDDVGNRDLVKVQSTVLVMTAFVLVIGAVVDLIQRQLDPRRRRA